MCNYREISDVGVEGPPLDVAEVEGVEHGFHYCDAGWVGSGFGVVFVGERFEERSE